ncbi:MAG: DUF1622 domain-containing protein [Acutalibacter sp.]|jgi:uncharacterized membrane protein
MFVTAAESFEFFMEDLLDVLVTNAIHLFELVGVIVLIIAGVRGVVNYVRHDPMVRLNLAKGMALCLEFKLGSEILRTVIVRDLSEIAIVGAIIALRAALTFLLHWEIKNEEAEAEAHLNQEFREKKAQRMAEKLEKKQP